jgi:CheY-like chemotaxis protein
LITDLQYPGIDLICRIRAHADTSDLPVIVLSSANGPAVAFESLRRDLHLAAVLPKPFSLRRLVALAGQVAQPAIAST